MPVLKISEGMSPGHQLGRVRWLGNCTAATGSKIRFTGPYAQKRPHEFTRRIEA
jgi:hypothetical protein